MKVFARSGNGWNGERSSYIMRNFMTLLHLLQAGPSNVFRYRTNSETILQTKFVTAPWTGNRATARSVCIGQYMKARALCMPVVGFELSTQGHAVTATRATNTLPVLLRQLNKEAQSVKRLATGWTTVVRFSSLPCPYRLWGPASLLSNVRRGLFPREWSGRSINLTTHLHPVSRSRMRAALPPRTNCLHVTLCNVFTLWSQKII
jgi:hypothetical protein